MYRSYCDSQNFFKDKSIVKRLLALEKVKIPTDRDGVLLDIGAGEGVITKTVLETYDFRGKIVLIEPDKVLFRSLEKQFKTNKRVKLHNCEFGEYKLPSRAFSVFSNMPFNYTSDILRKLLTPENQMDQAYLVIQKEALGIWAGRQVGFSRGETMKSLLSYPFYTFEVVYRFKKGDFKPATSVEAVFVKISKREKYLVRQSEQEIYRNYIAAISQVRVGEGVWKQLFTDGQLEFMYQNFNLVEGRGVSSQKAEAILNSYYSFSELVSEKKKVIVDGKYSEMILNLGYDKKSHSSFL
jgi:23S rRNA (adenine-N6)-dimethyltransferase